MRRGLLLLTIFTFLNAFQAYSQDRDKEDDLSISRTNEVTIYSVVNGGEWNNPGTWNLSRIPNSGDVVRISGERINITGIVATVKALYLNNILEVNSTRLHVREGAKLNITENLFVQNEKNADVEITLEDDNSEINVTQNVTFEKTSGTSNSKKLSVKAKDQSIFTIGGNLYWNLGLSNSEGHKEIELSNDAKLLINGGFYTTMTGGHNFDISLKNASQLIVSNTFDLLKSGGNQVNFKMEGSLPLFSVGQFKITQMGGSSATKFEVTNGKLQVTGTTELINQQNSQDLELIANGADSELWLIGDVTLNSSYDEDLYVLIENKSQFYLGGNVTRTNGLGNIWMQSNTTVEFNGSEAQSIPSETGSGNDEIRYGKIKLSNTSSEGIALTEDLIVKDHLTLLQGVLKSSVGSMIIFDKDATVDAGSISTYIDGPVKKIGLNPGENFTFPLGHLGTFAPITINNHDNNVDSDGEFITKYDNCPPPYGNVASGQVPVALDHVSQLESWTLERSVGSPDVDVRIHWSDATAAGISDTSQLVVAMYDNAASEWVNIGRSGSQGSAAPGMSGSIRNDIFCPPPYGNTRFTFGSISPQQNLLPVVLTNFGGTVIDNAVALSWTTSQEIGTKQFVVESSSDGINFSRIAAVQAQGDSNVKHLYLTTDDDPKVGANYYRLRQMDLNGFFTFSKVISVEYNEDVQISVFPNPVVDFITVKGNIPDHSNNPVKVFDQLGRLIFTGLFPSTAGMIHIDSEELQLENKGIYYLQVNIDGTSKSLKIIKS